MGEWNPEDDPNSCFDEKTLKEMLEFLAPAYPSNELTLARTLGCSTESGDFDDIDTQSLSTSATPPPPPCPSSSSKQKHKKVSHKVANVKEKKLFLTPTALRTESSSSPVSQDSPMLKVKDGREKKQQEALSLAELSWDLGTDPNDILSKTDEDGIEALNSSTARQKREAVSEIKARVSAIEESISLAKKVLSQLMRPQS